MRNTSLIMGCALIACTSLTAADGAWRHQFTAYFLGAGMDGDVAIGAVETSIDVGFDDILSNLEFGTMVNYRADKDRLSLGLDVIYMGLGADGPGGLAQIDFDQWMVEANAGWQVSDFLEVFAGLRYNDLQGTVYVTTPMAKAKTGESWVDPIVGVRFLFPLGESFSFIGRGDIGGFGVGADLTWQLGAYFQYGASETLSLLVGYRMLDIDYDEGTGADRFKYNVMTQGPAAGISWIF